MTETPRPDPWKAAQAFMWHAGTCDANHDNQPCSCGLSSAIAEVAAHLRERDAAQQQIATLRDALADLVIATDDAGWRRRDKRG